MNAGGSDGGVDSASHTGTGGGGASGTGGGTGSGGGVPMACAITVSSPQIQGSTMASPGGTCMPTLVNQTTIGIKFDAVDSNNNSALANIACSISPTGMPQTLHGRNGTAGCNMVIEFDAANGATDMWSDDASSTIDIVVTDISTASGTINATLHDSMGATMTVTGTF